MAARPTGAAGTVGWAGREIRSRLSADGHAFNLPTELSWRSHVVLEGLAGRLRAALEAALRAPEPEAGELAILKRKLREEIDHAAFNHHTLDPSSQGWEPNTPVVRSASIEACIAGAEREARAPEPEEEK